MDIGNDRGSQHGHVEGRGHGHGLGQWTCAIDMESQYGHWAVGMGVAIVYRMVGVNIKSTQHRIISSFHQRPAVAGM